MSQNPAVLRINSEHLLPYRHTRVLGDLSYTLHDLLESAVLEASLVTAHNRYSCG